MRVLIVTNSTNLLKRQTISPRPLCRCGRFMSSHILTPTVHCTPRLTPSLPVTYNATLNSYCTLIRLLDMNTFTLKISPRALATSTWRSPRIFPSTHGSKTRENELSRVQNRPSISTAYSRPIRAHPRPSITNPR